MNNSWILHKTTHTEGEQNPSKPTWIDSSEVFGSVPKLAKNLIHGIHCIIFHITFPGFIYKDITMVFTQGLTKPKNNDQIFPFFYQSLVRKKMRLFWPALPLMNPSWRLLPNKRILSCLTKPSTQAHWLSLHGREGVTPPEIKQPGDSLTGREVTPFDI